MQHPFPALAHRPFAALWCGQTLSRVGDSLYLLTVSWWLVQHTGSPAAVGRLFIVSLIPTVLFLLIGGALVDKLPRLRIMLVADLVCGTVVATVAALAWAGQLQIWHLWAASFCFGTAEAFFMPAYLSVVPDLTPPGLLSSANSLTSISAQIGRFSGPALGSVIIACGG